MNDDLNPSPPQRWFQNPAILSTVIKGVFGLLCAIIGYFTVVRENPLQVSSAVESSLANLNDVAHHATVTPNFASLSEPSPNLLLSFAAFQQRMATSDIGVQERALLVRPLMNQRVVWKGYVDAIIPMNSPTRDSAITVSLVESQAKLGQSMFKTPAHCRFGQDALNVISTLAPGDQITISGIFANHSLIATEITDAHLMSIYGRPLPKTASMPDYSQTR